VVGTARVASTARVVGTARVASTARVVGTARVASTARAARAYSILCSISGREA
jgi:hypothetical protein